ncbi:helix-turn-helix domain-containing protein [Phenylobacterium sp.]|uniref:helix-turn-helix domain-containing protein n=1 Tax=Phenylobacterium sp. TaxID=1871053 RepID=UPI0035AFDCCC
MDSPDLDVDDRLARRLAELRRGEGWSLEELAALSGVSRATLSRVERAEVSPTAAVLGRLCAAFGVTMSRLLAEVEGTGAALVRAEAQPVWTDPQTGLVRRSVSPPSAGLAGELIEVRLPAGTRVDYPGPPRAGLEHHLYLLEGTLEVTLEGERHRLQPGDCLRYRLFGPNSLAAPGPDAARYLIAII